MSKYKSTDIITIGELRRLLRRRIAVIDLICRRPGEQGQIAQAIYGGAQTELYGLLRRFGGRP